jgi:hypothetical protein
VSKESASDGLASSSPHFPSAATVIARLREVYGPEGDPSSAIARWVVKGDFPGREVALHIDRKEPVPTGSGADDDGATVIWVTRPGELKPERCPIVTMRHLDAFLALVSVARRSPAPVHGNVCPGTK